MAIVYEDGCQGFTCHRVACIPRAPRHELKKLVEETCFHSARFKQPVAKFGGSLEVAYIHQVPFACDGAVGATWLRGAEGSGLVVALETEADSINERMASGTPSLAVL